jgi:hypothetical protein
MRHLLAMKVVPAAVGLLPLQQCASKPRMPEFASALPGLICHCSEDAF